MLNEIRQEPKAVETTLKHNEIRVKRIAEQIHSKNIEFIYVIGSGTSYNAGLTFHYTLFSLDIYPSSLIPASEFPYWVPKKIDKKSLIVAISQSGESLDVLKAVDTSKDRGIDVLSVTNTKESTLAGEANYMLHTQAGRELAVTATKSYITQLAVLFLLTFELAVYSHKHNDTLYLRKKLFETPNMIEETLKKTDEKMLELALKYKESNYFFALGSGVSYPLALETALKFKEACNIYAEGFANREFLHGPLQLVNENTPVIIFDPGQRNETMSVVNQITGYNAPVISVTSDDKVAKASDDAIIVPEEVPSILSPIINIVPIQLFVYYSSVMRGLNPDKPEKLSKVVKF